PMDAWENISNEGAMETGVATAPQSDSRDMVFNAAGDLLEADDGGVYRMQTYNFDKTRRSWDSVNGNLQVTEFFTVAYDSLSKSIFGGTQDNGIAEQPTLGTTKDWHNVNTGDGTYVAVYNNATAKT